MKPFLAAIHSVIVLAVDGDSKHVAHVLRKTGSFLKKKIKLISKSLQKCAQISELPYNISTMVDVVHDGPDIRPPKKFVKLLMCRNLRD